MKTDSSPETETQTESQPVETTDKPGLARRCASFIGRLIHRALHIVMELVVVASILCVIAIAATMWRLMSGPVDIGFAREYIEQALKDEEDNYSVKMGQLLLHWPSLSSPLTLGSSNINVYQDGQPVISVGRLALGLSSFDLLQGNVYPTSIILDKPYLHLIREGRTDIKLNIRSQDAQTDIAGSDPVARESLIEGVIAQLSQPISPESTGPLSKLQRLEIKRARAMVADQYYGLSWLVPKADLTFARVTEGLSIKSNLYLPTRSKDHDLGRASLDILYRRDAQDFSINANFDAIDAPALTARLIKMDWLRKQKFMIGGDVSMLVTKDFEITEASSNINIPAGSFEWKQQLRYPVSYDGINIQADYNKEDARDVINLRQFDIAFRDFTAKAKSTITRDHATGAIGGDLVLDVPQIAPDKVKYYWPIVLEKEGATEWMNEKITGKLYKDASASLKFSATPPQGETEQDWSVDVTDIVADFAFDDTRIDYRPPLDAVENASGTGHYEDDVLTVTLSEGHLKSIKVNSAQAVLKNMHIAGAGTASIALDISTSLPDIFEFLSKEPISLREKANIDPQTLKGASRVNVQLEFPTIKSLRTEDVKVTIDGEATDVYIPNIVRSMPLQGGPLKVKIIDGLIKVSGKANLGAYPVDMKWERFLDSDGKPYRSAVKVSLVSDEAFREKFDFNLTEIKGKLPLSIVYVEKNKTKASLAVSADLTPVRLDISSLGYLKPEGIAGKVSMDVEVRNDKVEKIKNLRLESKDLKLPGGTLNFNKGRLIGGSLGSASIGDNRIDIEFELTEADMLKIRTQGAVIDARPFLSDDSKSEDDQRSVMLHAKTKKMITADGRFVRDVEIFFESDATGKLSRIEMDATAGKGAIYLRYKPDKNGRLKLTLEADDAGATLHAFGLYDTVQGGKIIVNASPLDGGYRGDLSGKAKLIDFSVTEVPALAHLLGAMSLTGIGDLLGQDGIGFSKLETDFKWIFRPQGDLYTFKEGRSSGNALGLTFEGRIDKEKKNINIHGTIVPVSMVSDFLGQIPIIGDILTAGSGVFAATYVIKGDVKDPKVSVNPLSVLAPGILRKIFFED